MRHYKEATIEKNLDKITKKLNRTEEGKAVAVYLKALRKEKRYVYDISNNMAMLAFLASEVQEAIGD